MQSLGFFPAEVVPYLAIDSLCPQKAVSPGLSYVAIFNWNSLHLTWGKKKTMMWRTLSLPLFFRVHMCSPKQCISPTADASCDLNGAGGCHFWRNWHVGKKRWKLWDYAEPSGNGPTHGGSCRQLPDECWEDPGRWELLSTLHSNWNEGMTRASMLSIRKRPSRKD